jgi:hypothetical protein
MSDNRVITMNDYYSLEDYNFTSVRREGETERPFKLGVLMDKVRRSTSKTVVRATIDATHSGTIVNQRVYPGIHMRDAVPTWLNPYPKPVLEHHPKRNAKEGDPEPRTLGRVCSAEFIQLVDDNALRCDHINSPHRSVGSGYTRLRADIGDPGAIERIADKRFLTVSSGMGTNHLYCSIPGCGSDWGNPKARCEHRPGQSYQLNDSEAAHTMYFITGRLFYDHLAETFRPASPYSTVLACELLDQDIVNQFFNNGELISGVMSSAVLIDSQDGATELLFDRSGGDKSTGTEGWTKSQWAEAFMYDALATAGQLSDQSTDKLLPMITAYRTSDGKPSRGQPRFRVGPRGVLPICDMETAQAALTVAEHVKGANQASLQSRILTCMDTFVQPVGDLTMGNNDPATKWAEVVSAAKTLTDADWAGFDGDLFSLASDEGAAEERGVVAGIIAQDSRLSVTARKALPDSSFCGPNRTFVAHDSAYLRTALARLPQSDLKTEQKAKVLSLLMTRAKTLGVELTDSSLSYDSVSKLLDTKAPASLTAPAPPAAPDGETEAQKVSRLEKHNTALTATVSDLEAANRGLHDSLRDSEGKMKILLVDRLFERQSALKKPQIVALDTEEKRQDYLARLKMRTVASLNDTLADLDAETITLADAAAGDLVIDPTLGDTRNNQLGPDGKPKVDPKVLSPAEQLAAKLLNG